MKPQNYSLKFQNSLAESRIIPGSQHLVARSNAVVPKGQRAVRKPTKAQQLRAGRISKNTIRKIAQPPASSSATPLVQLLSKKAQKQAETSAKAERRAAEKLREVEIAASTKSILKTTKPSPEGTKTATKTSDEGNGKGT